MRVNIITMGCSKNKVDSENIAGHLESAGMKVRFDYYGRQLSDIIVVNTCGFIGDAKEESVNTILEQAGIKERGRRPRVLVVVGCLVERYRRELKKEIPAVDAWFGTNEWDKLIKYLVSLAGKDSKKIPFAAKRKMSSPRHYAYLKIAEGCDRHCSYCAIPKIRHRHISRPMEEIVEEARGMVASGVKELIVIAQDTTYYGIDRYGKRMISELMDRLATESGAQWIRLHYTYPADFPMELLDVMRRHANICRYIDIPLQHISTPVLQSMQRHIDKDQTLRLIREIRRKLPEVCLRTTLIVGYPNESQEAFGELKDFVREAKFDRLGVFAYSPEEGTPAMVLGDPVSDDEKQRRRDEIMEIQEEIALEKNQQLLGKEVEVMIDGVAEDFYAGRTQWDSPEVDNEVIVFSDHDYRPGDVVKVRINEAWEHDVSGTPVDENNE